ncbi:MAG: hypothetical protein KJ887_05865 [Candidatus Omnitrophica bacterium]|nr:hypothetical protein [Candidatus Omnitrophota bacterium]MBU1047170.1 hypothetical protein [Candidatus Omnitrophota bacterium]MBU1630468.1 hypothetical protein [Candidatus Omnitrophota bacterium]MBU1766637.1 hypothetical protein [Candidatus Omnitrophota bacterium]MBU1889470.1 hypothetical protein [Candidatus Omnitrophota bacterium]
MLFLKLLFSPKLRTLRNLLLESKTLAGPPDKDPFILSMMFFSHLFYMHGFLCANQPIPAFPNAYKNISNHVFKSTYVALPIYFGYRCGLHNSNIKTNEEFKQIILKKYPTLDHDVADILISEWSNTTKEHLNHLLFKHFDKYSVFQKVFKDATATEKWFINFLNQTFDYALQAYPIS